MPRCERCLELEQDNILLLSKLAAIERMTVPKERQLIQFAPEPVAEKELMPWDTVKAKPSRAESMRLGDESIDNIVLPKPGDPPLEF